MLFNRMFIICAALCFTFSVGACGLESGTDIDQASAALGGEASTSPVAGNPEGWIKCEKTGEFYCPECNGCVNYRQCLKCMNETQSPEGGDVSGPETQTPGGSGGADGVVN